MKKFSFAKIVSFAMVCAMLMGALAIGVYAAEEVAVEIVSNNVFYGDKFEIMYAIKAPEGATIEAVDSEGNEIKVLPFTDENGNSTVNIDGVDYPMYILEEGVAAQAIDEVITVTVTAGNNVATQKYSVLEYIYERMYVKADVEGAELDMFNALLTYANAADIAINGASAEESLGNLVYVSAVDCTFDGATSGVVSSGTVLYFETDLVAEEGYVINWIITDFDNGKTVKIDSDTMANNGYEVNGNVKVQAVVEESTADKTVVLLATFELGDNGSAEHKDGSAKTSYSETDGSYTLSMTDVDKFYPSSYDAAGNSCIKFGTSSVVGKFTMTVPDNVTQVVFYVAKYKANTSKINVNGTEYTLTKNSNDGEYDEIVVDTTSSKTITFTTVSGGVRAMLNTVEFHGYAN